MINLTYLGKLIYVSIGIFGRFTMEDRKHTHDMEIDSKIFPSSSRCMNSRDGSLEDRPSIVTKAFPCISLVVPGHFYWFCWIYVCVGLGSVGVLRESLEKVNF